MVPFQLYQDRNMRVDRPLGKPSGHPVFPLNQLPQSSLSKAEVNLGAFSHVCSLLTLLTLQRKDTPCLFWDSIGPAASSSSFRLAKRANSISCIIASGLLSPSSSLSADVDETEVDFVDEEGVLQDARRRHPHTQDVLLQKWNNILPSP